jgi:hypothetical protein
MSTADEARRRELAAAEARFIRELSAAADEVERAPPNPDERARRALLNLIASIRSLAIEGEAALRPPVSLCICGPEWRNPNCDEHGDAHQACVEVKGGDTRD